MIILKTKKMLLIPLKNQSGFVLIIAMLFLVLLSMLGFATLNTTDIETLISGNVRQEKQIFYGTESGCRRGGQWLYNLALSQADLYADDDTFQDYIDAGKFDEGMVIRSITAGEESNLGDATYPVKYLYDIEEQENASGKKIACQPMPGSNPNILKCFFQVDCSTITASSGSRNIALRIGKPTQF